MNNKTDKFSKALCWVLLATTVARGLGLLIQLVMFATGAAKNAANTVKLGFVELKLAETLKPSLETATMQTVCNIAMLVVGVAVSAWLVVLILKILKPAMAGQPFCGCVSTNLKKMGWVQLIGGAVNAILQVVSYGTVTKGFDLPKLFSGDVVTDIRCKLAVDTSFIFIALLLFLLAAIFRYGEQLQQLSDETL